MNLNDRIEQLEAQVKALTSKLTDLTTNTEEKFNKPVSVVGGGRDRVLLQPIDAKAGRGQISGGAVIWNNKEIGAPINAEPAEPTVENGDRGYNKHTHSRFAGGALILDFLEIVEYNLTQFSNPHSQAFWQTQPEITKAENSDGETVDKIGGIDLEFNADTGLWEAAAHTIDVEKCYLVKRDPDQPGGIAVDENGNQMKSTLYNSDPTKTSVLWDKDARVWRFLAVYAPEAD